MDTAGRTALVLVGAGEEHLLDERPATLPRAPVVLSVSSVGTHLKGMLDGAVVAHTHRKASSHGGAGIFLAGSGVVRILEIRGTPLDRR